MVIKEKGRIRSVLFLSFTLDMAIVERNPTMLRAGIINVVMKTSRMISNAILSETGCKDCGRKNKSINNSMVGINKGCNT
jgi:hypothetical protein